MPLTITLKFLPATQDRGASVQVNPALAIRYSVSMFPDREIVFKNSTKNQTLVLVLRRAFRAALEPPMPGDGVIYLYPRRASQARLKVREHLGLRRRSNAPLGPPDADEDTSEVRHSAGFHVFTANTWEQMLTDGAYDPDQALPFAQPPIDDAEIMFEC